MRKRSAATSSAPMAGPAVLTGRRAPDLFLAFAAVSGFIAVAMGALGAHALKGRLAPDLVAAYQTAVQYQFWHTLAMLWIAGLWRQRLESGLLSWSAVAMLAGIVLFSGSLYALVLTEQRWFGIITPFGGLSFLAGWLLLVLDRVGVLRSGS